MRRQVGPHDDVLGIERLGAAGRRLERRRRHPQPVTGLTGVSAITAGGQHTCALKSDATVACWGWNQYGQLGDGTNTTSNTPRAVVGLPG